MKLTILSNDSSVVHVQCADRISQDDFPRGSEPLGALLAPVGGFGRKVLLNLEEATFIDSSGISWLLITHKHFLQNGGRLIVHSVPPLVNQVFQLVRLHLIMAVAPDVAAAQAIATRDEK
jgi:anti-anti-sigma factor